MDKDELGKLKDKIKTVFNEHQRKGWDGYGAEPMLYLEQSLKFADQIPVNLIKSLDIIPENDGCMCFEWFKSHEHFITISVCDDKLIYTYKIGDDDSYGEIYFTDRKWLFEIVKKFYKGVE